MGAYSELDAALREDDSDFVDDDAFVEDEGPGVPNPDSTGGPQQAEAASIPAAQPVEAQATVPAQPAGDTAGKAEKEQADEDAKRKAHEEAEAKRKAEWQAKRKQKKAEEKLKLAQIENMSNDEVLAEALKRVGEDRNAAESVKKSDHFERRNLLPWNKVFAPFTQVACKSIIYAFDIMVFNEITAEMCSGPHGIAKRFLHLRPGNINAVCGHFVDDFLVSAQSLFLVKLDRGQKIRIVPVKIKPDNVEICSMVFG